MESKQSSFKSGKFHMYQMMHTYHTMLDNVCSMNNCTYMLMSRVFERRKGLPVVGNVETSKAHEGIGKFHCFTDKMGGRR